MPLHETLYIPLSASRQEVIKCAPTGSSHTAAPRCYRYTLTGV